MTGQAGMNLLVYRPLAMQKTGRQRPLWSLPDLCTIIVKGHIGIKEVVEYLKLNVHTVYKLVRHGEIPAIKLGGSWRFRKQEIYAWLVEKMTREKKARYEKWQKKYK